MQQGTSSFIDPTGHAHARQLLEGGVGNAATRYEETKRKRYSDIEESEFEFIPFILEAQGGVGKAAITFSKELERRKRLKTCSATRDRSGKLDLLTALNIEVQRFNSTAILEPVPFVEPLCGSDLQKHDQAMEQERLLAKERLRRARSQPCRGFVMLHRRNTWPHSRPEVQL